MAPAPVLRALLTAALAFGVLSGCSGYDADDARYATGYGSHEPLAVVGYPTTGSLGITQEVVWQIADGKAGELAGLAAETDGDSPEKTAEKTASNWISAFGKGARGKVTAEFYDEGSVRQTVVLYFHDTGQIKQLHVRVSDGGGKDEWRVVMAEPDPEEAVAVLPWVPRKPGELGSKTPQ
ncbi:hypothetical protein [Streptomyces subrutilus]|uniref:Lipoprotein n=1 Tax=Streptomyces subrutilus TaxID=36818 RepID=A0A1E5PXQ7_9ACTN|nr:hypothetical protein [Streptomyces subrutilus]OEJ34359.1 hypothetical protein BGK67_26160 [Streptomyces subrutilus]